MKNIILFSSVFLLASCYWYDGCFYTPQQVTCFKDDVYNGYKVIQGIQKKDTIGHTDTVQREIDLRACGVKQMFGGTLDLNTAYEGLTDAQITERYWKIVNCMESKDYIFHDYTKCTRKLKPTGLCN
ncbi:hypothetical protein [Stenoxybacter acetivorans]|uniref:hypothetical protein n=1 Tax=Stenoxybacter acetivorans TaxID=422441 RepID=UPI00068C6BB1|nr:hypothetical protein [Stenoxybacter acetivorans]